MKRVFTVFLIMLMIFSAAACGGKNGNKGDAANATQPANAEAPADDAAAPEATEQAATITPADGAATYGNITLAAPEGWVIAPGGVGGTEDDNSLFVNFSENPYYYVWVLISTRANIDANIAVDSSAEIEPFTVGGISWQGKDQAFYGEIAGELYFITLSPFLHHSDEAVQRILASLAENAA